jgi:hypothetical protein
VPVESLSLTHEEAWTLHDVLRTHLRREHESENEGGTGKLTGSAREAFERLDDGTRRFESTQLEAIQRVLARAHHTRRWEVERPQLEALLHRVAGALDGENDDENGESDGEDRL